MLKKSIKTKVNMNLSSVTQGCYPISSFWAVLSKKKKKCTHRECVQMQCLNFLWIAYMLYLNHMGVTNDSDKKWNHSHDTYCHMLT